MDIGQVQVACGARLRLAVVAVVAVLSRTDERHRAAASVWPLAPKERAQCSGSSAHGRDLGLLAARDHPRPAPTDDVAVTVAVTVRLTLTLPGPGEPSEAVRVGPWPVLGASHCPAWSCLSYGRSRQP